MFSTRVRRGLGAAVVSVVVMAGPMPSEVLPAPAPIAAPIIDAGGSTPYYQCVQWRTRYCRWTS